MHSFWKTPPKEQTQLVSKTVDLRSAYKQFPIAERDRKFAILTLNEPDGRGTFGFVSRTLPFGSVASVLHFNRLARLLHHLGLQARIAWTNYYDDYPVIDFKVLADHTTAAIRTITGLLGFECSLDKELPFSTKTDVLGVTIDLGRSGEGVVTVSNKADRVSELAEVVNDILTSGKVRVRELPSLFGRELFAESQFIGRAGRLALCELRHLENSKAGILKIDDIQRQAFNIWLDRYRFGRPRTLTVTGSHMPLVVFTDGACETKNDKFMATVGAVMFDPLDNACQAFGAEVHPHVVDEWTRAGKQHPVALTEMYAVSCARNLWRKRIDARRIIIFIDNQSVLDALIKGYSAEPMLKKLLLNFEVLDNLHPCLGWFSRVPSSSNIADLPSRGRWEELRCILPNHVVLEAACPLKREPLEKVEDC